MQSSSLTRTMPSSARLKLAPVGQTVTQGASAQCRQDFGKWTTRAGPVSGTASKLWMRLRKVPSGWAP